MSIINSAINELPVELHVPSYKFCGPGTKLQKRLARGDRGVNLLDESCRKHDIQYAKYKDLKLRHAADKILAREAMERFRSKDASFGERMSALGVAGVMKAKVKLGMGYIAKAKKNIILKKNHIKKLEKMKNVIKKLFTEIENCILDLNREEFSHCCKKTKIHVNSKKQKLNNVNEKPSVKVFRKRKLDNEPLNKNLTAVKVSRKRKLHDLDIEPLPLNKKELSDNKSSNNRRFMKVSRKRNLINVSLNKNLMATKLSKKRKLCNLNDEDLPLNKKQKCVKVNRKRKLNDESLILNEFKKQKLDEDKPITFPTSSKSKKRRLSETDSTVDFDNDERSSKKPRIYD